MVDLASSRARQVLPAAAAAVSDVVRRLPHDPTHRVWSCRTPCARWDLRALLNHLTAEHLWVPRLLAGQTLAEVGDAYDGDVLGGDPPAAWEAAVTRSVLAWAAVDDETVVIEMSSGPTTRQEYAEQLVVDLVVHGWDLSRASGLPYAPAREAVQAVLDYERPRLADGAGWPGLFDPAVRPSTRPTDPLTEAVALTGRDPGWTG